MNTQNIKIQHTTDNNLREILHIHLQAFPSEKVVAKLTDDLLKDITSKPLLSLMAVYENKPVGHILFTKAYFKNDPESPLMHYLAPLGILPEFQNKGLGGLLIREGLKQLKEMGSEIVFVLGHPPYYPKHGFINNAKKFGFQTPYPIAEKNNEAFMVQELTSGALKKYNGIVMSADGMLVEEYWRE